MSDDLLPPSATSQERAVSLALARLAAVPVPLRLLWDPADCPAALLPWLAWSFSVDEWDAAWSESAQRASIQEAVAIHRRKGTIWAIKRALATAGYAGAEIIEGGSGWAVGDSVAVGDAELFVGSGGAWAIYSLRLAQPVVDAQVAQIRTLLKYVAPARCHLNLFLRETAPWVVGDGSIVGTAGLAVY
jgi:phage tail P2-like protein